MTFTLENESLSLQIQRKGAELSSLKANGLEYLWQADPAVWGRHAPVLFPIVGKLRNNQYRWRDRTYTLPQHGFARDLEFEVVQQTRESLTLSAKATEETLRDYPFPFELQIIHTLVGNRVDVRYRVINPGNDVLLFSIGAHPGFRCPLLPGERFEDYYLEFDQPETLEKHLIEDSMFNGKTEPLLKESRNIPLERSLFEHDAIVVKNFRSQSVTLKSRTNAHWVKVSFPDFPYLGIWTKNAHSPFLCIEPWFGLADRTEASGKFEEKEGIRTLQSGEEFSCLHQIEIR